mmetsp:Transcript_5443/g.18768  ORF Transcript_5443/g.18768 Transcript_5443/m.18768 type:complete len:257 (+) Transcript_5443:2050-2820(+)
MSLGGLLRPLNDGLDRLLGDARLDRVHFLGRLARSECRHDATQLHDAQRFEVARNLGVELRILKRVEQLFLKGARQHAKRLHTNLLVKHLLRPRDDAVAVALEDLVLLSERRNLEPNGCRLRLRLFNLLLHLLQLVRVLIFGLVELAHRRLDVALLRVSLHLSLRVILLNTHRLFALLLQQNLEASLFVLLALERKLKALRLGRHLGELALEVSDLRRKLIPVRLELFDALLLARDVPRAHVRRLFVRVAVLHRLG